MDVQTGSGSKFSQNTDPEPTKIPESIRIRICNPCPDKSNECLIYNFPAVASGKGNKRLNKKGALHHVRYSIYR